MAPDGAFVITADVALAAGCDPAAVGAAVTTELCGHWEHAGACRWPHHSAIDEEREPARLTTVVVAALGERPAVRARVEEALRAASAWRVVALGDRPVATAERELAASLLAGPRAGDAA